MFPCLHACTKAEQLLMEGAGVAHSTIPARHDRSQPASFDLLMRLKLGQEACADAEDQYDAGIVRTRVSAAPLSAVFVGASRVFKGRVKVNMQELFSR